MVLLPQVGKQGGAKAAERLLNLVKQKLRVTVSIGITSFPDDGASKKELVDKADSAMHQAKKLGKGRMCAYGEKDKK